MTHLGGDDTPIKARGIETYRGEEDLPSSRELTVADWESGALDTNVWDEDTGKYDVQSSNVLKGNYSLRFQPGSSTRGQITSFEGLSSYPQPGDEITWYCELTHTDDQIGFGWCLEYVAGAAYNNRGYQTLIRADTDKLYVQTSKNLTDSDSTTANISSHLNETLRVEMEHKKDNSDITVTLYVDSTDTELASLTHSPTEDYESGGVWVYANSGSTAPTIYADGFLVTRRTPDYLSETKKGTTNVGNEVTPSGAINTGPQSAPTNSLREIFAEAPVDSSATQGDTSLLTLLQSGLDPAMYMERTLDGQGGAYGHQLQAPLGRFSRLNANLSWEYDSLADVPSLNTGSSGGSNYSFSLIGTPRRVQVNHDGSSNTDEYGGIQLTTIVSPQTLDSYRITFKNVSFTRNFDRNAVVMGLTDTEVDVDPRRSGNGIYYSSDRNDSIGSVSNGTFQDQLLNNEVFDDSNEHDITLEYSKNEDILYVYVDGVQEVFVDGQSLNGNIKPFFYCHDANEDTSSSETAEVEQVTVEPLPEVLN